MCLIIYAPKGAIIPFELVSSAKQRNNDGWGLMYHDNSTIRVRKNLNMHLLDGQLKKLEKYDRLVHLRMATHGGVSIQNCHPFKVQDGLYMMHNGILSQFSNYEKDKSDTAFFNEHIVQQLAKEDDRILEKYHFRTVMEEFSGGFNKLAFMDKYGNVLRTGEWVSDSYHGIHLSNKYAYSTSTIKLDKEVKARSAYDEPWDWEDYDYDYKSDSKFDLLPSSTSKEKAPVTKYIEVDLKDDDDEFNYYEDDKVEDEDLQTAVDVTSLSQLASVELSNLEALCATEPRLVAMMIKQYA